MNVTGRILKTGFEPSTRAILLVALVLPLVAAAWAQAPSGSRSGGRPTSSAAPKLPRGRKLMLKDGSFQLVREFELDGERVRYYSIDRSQWEEIPAELVDWDQTKKVEAEETERDHAAVARVEKQELARLAEPIDIDASLEAAPGVFLPPGEGLFAFDGRAILKLGQAEINSKINKTKALERVLVPIPIVPNRHTISIHGTRSTLRVRYAQPEFYMRTADGREPTLELVRAQIHGADREIEKVDQLMGQQRATGETLPIARWLIAQGVYRFTLGQAIEPGEYALIEIVQTQTENMSLYVWDFGVDRANPGASPK
jgi:hypothetical protein